MKKKNNKKRLERFGRYIAFILRHNPQAVDKRGWALVTHLMELAKAAGYALTFEDLTEVVETDDKGRYAFNNEQTHIRALQGHSFPVDLELVNVVPPSTLYHGTAERYVKAIMETGVTPQKRHAVHLSPSAATAVSVGSRHGKPVVLVVDTHRMHQDGYTFQCSQNGVWLTDYVPVRYISLSS